MLDLEDIKARCNGLNSVGQLESIWFENVPNEDKQKLDEASKVIGDLSVTMPLEAEGKAEAQAFLEACSKPPLRFNPLFKYEGSPIGFETPIFYIAIKSDNEAIQNLLPIMLDSGLAYSNILNDQHFMTLCLRGAPIHVIDNWLSHFPEHAHTYVKDGTGNIDERNWNLINIAIERKDPDLLRYALERGIEVRLDGPNSMLQLDRLVSDMVPGDDVKINEMIMLLIDHGHMEVIQKRGRTTDGRVDEGVEPSIWFYHNNRFSGFGDFFNSIYYDLAHETEATAEDLRQAAAQQTPEAVDSFDPVKLIRAHAIGALDELCDPDLWDGSMETLYKLHMDLPKHISQAVAEKMLPSFKTLEALPDSHQVAGPFDLGEPLAPPPQAKAKGGGNG